MAITAVAVVALIVFVVAMVPKFDADKLFDIAPSAAAGASDFIPFGYAGVLAALVYGIWFFLAVEGVPLAAEEARDPRKDMPRGIITAMSTLLVFAALMLLLAPGGAGSSVIADSDNPLPLAVRTAFGGDTWVADVVNYVGLAGLVASFFSIVYAYSRQLFALSRPATCALPVRHRLPEDAVPGARRAGHDRLPARRDHRERRAADQHRGLRRPRLVRADDARAHRAAGPRARLERPYRTPGGVVTTGIALVLAIAAVVATFIVDEKAAAITAGIFVVALAYFWFYSRHRLVANAPEEEFAAIEQAESELQ